MMAVEQWRPRIPPLSVSITGDVLTVRGERRFEHDLKDEGYYRLEIRLPKVEAVKPKEIKIDLV